MLFRVVFKKGAVMLSKIRKGNLFVMLAFLFGVLVPAGWIVALPTASARAPALKPPLDINGFECDFGLQHQVTTIQSRTSPNTETISIGDHVWFDANENGIQDAFPDSRSEEGRRVPRTGIGGVVCVLCQQGKGAPVASTLSNAKGHYSFTLQLSESATYYIVVEPPEEVDVVDEFVLGVADGHQITSFIPLDERQEIVK